MGLFSYIVILKTKCCSLLKRNVYFQKTKRPMIIRFISPYSSKYLV